MIDGFGADIKVGDLLLVVQKTKKNVSMKVVKLQGFEDNRFDADDVFQIKADYFYMKLDHNEESLKNFLSTNSKSAAAENFLKKWKPDSGLSDGVEIPNKKKKK